MHCSEHPIIGVDYVLWNYFIYAFFHSSVFSKETLKGDSLLSAFPSLFLLCCLYTYCCLYTIEY